MRSIEICLFTMFAMLGESSFENFRLAPNIDYRFCDLVPVGAIQFIIQHLSTILSVLITPKGPSRWHSWSPIMRIISECRNKGEK